MFSPNVAKLVRENEPLASKCWLRIGGPARFFAEVETVEQLRQLLADANQAQLLVRVLGGGSNLLIRPEGVDGLVIELTGQLAEIQVVDQHLRAGGGADLSDTVLAAARAGLAGLEHLAGIPGTTGGAVVCNAGVKNEDIGSRVAGVTVCDKDGSIRRLTKSELQFSYRRSNLEDVVVTHVEFELTPSSSEEVTRRVQSAWIVKRAQQPSDSAHVAQAFMEPSEGRLGDLLEAAGMRSASEGDVAMCPQYPGFIVANEHATAEQVLALIRRVSRAVEVQTGIQLQPQLRIW
ncbi:MAG: UDP-N-acetylenolpyruvoylglucosamine reductase [Pirellulaceae bacterium]|nr:MAG: UDP-N-acetylenolpyruvoylglucosamine reductase [Pirellulaceae bacterium]